MNFKTFFDLAPSQPQQKSRTIRRSSVPNACEAVFELQLAFLLGRFKSAAVFGIRQTCFLERYRTSVAFRKPCFGFSGKPWPILCAKIIEYLRFRRYGIAFTAIEVRRAASGKCPSLALGNWFQFAARKSGLRFASTDLQELFMAQVGLGSVPDSAPILKTCETHLAEWIDALLKLENSLFSAPNWWSLAVPNFPELSSRMLCGLNSPKAFPALLLPQKKAAIACGGV